MKSLLDRLFGRTTSEPAPEPVPAPDAPAEALADLADMIRRDVAAGYYDDDAILRNAMGAFEGELDAAVLRSETSRLLRAALAEHAAAEQDWTGPTDYDRLDAAFEALEADGVIARQNFTCCGTCGSAEIWDEITAAREAGLAARGYAFFHMQDTESAVDGGGLYLNYGACEDGEAAALDVGHDIVAVLEAHGLTTDWNGSWDRRICIELDWKRRRSI